MCIGNILSGYRRRLGPDGCSPHEVIFGVLPQSSREPPGQEMEAENGSLARAFEQALAELIRASRYVAAPTPSDP